MILKPSAISAKNGQFKRFDFILKRKGSKKEGKIAFVFLGVIMPLSVIGTTVFVVVHENMPQTHSGLKQHDRGKQDGDMYFERFHLISKKVFWSPFVSAFSFRNSKKTGIGRTSTRNRSVKFDITEKWSRSWESNMGALREKNRDESRSARCRGFPGSVWREKRTRNLWWKTQIR